MWQRCAQYLRNIAGMILVASIVVWALGYFPRQEESDLSCAERYEHSYIGQVGHLCEPAFEPLGLDWKASVSLLSGVAAKELMVSTLGVLYSNDTDNNPAQLKQNLASSGDFTTPSALALLVFTLLYMPCIGTITAIGSESGWKWAIASAVYSTTVAWLCAFAVYHITQLFM
jgi:ferrous iron transport protein B